MSTALKRKKEGQIKFIKQKLLLAYYPKPKLTFDAPQIVLANANKKL